MKFTIIKSCLARFSGIFAVGTPSNIHGTAISYHCAKFGAFVNSVTILTLTDLTNNHLISNKQEWNNYCFIKNAHKISLNLPTRKNRKRQGTSAIHMSHVYQNCQRANGLAWTACMKNQNIVAMNISFFKTHRDSRILHNRTAKKTWQIM